MRKGKTVMGQGIYSLSDGVQVQTVTDILVSEANDAVIALLVDEGGLMGTSKIVPMSAITRFGPAAVMVRHSDVILEADDDPAVKDILDRDETLLGSKVLTTDGDDLGSIGDIYFDERDGRILGFEVSGGRLGDMMEGTSFLRLDEIEVAGPDAVITRIEAKDHLAEQKGGLAAAVEDAQGRAQELGDQAKDAVDDARGRADEANDPDRTLVGRRSRRDVTDRTGSILVAAGQRIDRDDARRARESGVIDELYAAAGLRRERSPSEQAEEAAQRASESASDMWQRFTQGLSQLGDEAGRRLDAEGTKRRLSQVTDAIGRPVTKVILDRQDDVILDIGDLITHQAVQRAYENGMLDTLLDSVYVAEMTFDRDELRAHIPGDSRVEEAHGGAELVDELEHERDQLEGGSRQEEGREAASGGSRSSAPEPDETARGSEEAMTASPPSDKQRRARAGRGGREPARIDIETGAPSSRKR